MVFITLISFLVHGLVPLPVNFTNSISSIAARKIPVSLPPNIGVREACSIVYSTAFNGSDPEKDPEKGTFYFFLYMGGSEKGTFYFFLYLDPPASFVGE